MLHDAFSATYFRVVILTILIFCVSLQRSVLEQNTASRKCALAVASPAPIRLRSGCFHSTSTHAVNSSKAFFCHSPCSRRQLSPIGERNGGAPPYDPLFTLLLCDILRTDLSSARHSAECASANPRGLCGTKRGPDDTHLLLRCTTCHPHRHDMGHWGDEKRGRHPRPCLGRNKPGGRYYHRAGGVRCFVPRLPSHYHCEVVSLL